MKRNLVNTLNKYNNTFGATNTPSTSFYDSDIEQIFALASNKCKSQNINEIAYEIAIMSLKIGFQRGYDYKPNKITTL